MKIGILTQHLGNNYGGILQNWALQQVLKDLGYIPITIKYIHRYKLKKGFNYIYSIGAYIIKHLIRHRTRIYNKLPWERKPNNELFKFIKNNIHLSKYQNLNNKGEKKLLRNRFKYIIIGSDQVWRPKYNKNYLNLMYCSIVPKESDICRIAYAASFGTKDWEYDVNQSEMAKKAIKGFKAISVREKSGIKLCKEYLNADASFVLDPTFLLTPQHYLRLIPENTLRNLGKGKMGIYILDDTEEKRNLIDEISQVLKLEPHYIGKINQKTYQKDSIEEWLAAFAKCEFIITDSFHGTAFSIIFNKPFITILNKDRGMERFISLLSELDLLERLMNPSEIQKGQIIIRNDIDWGKVNSKLNNLRRDSINFLTNALDLK